MLAVGVLGPVGEHHLESESILSKDCSEHEINGVYKAFEEKVYDDLRSISNRGTAIMRLGNRNNMLKKKSCLKMSSLKFTLSIHYSLSCLHLYIIFNTKLNSFSIFNTLLLLNHQWNQFLLQFINTSEGMT